MNANIIDLYHSDNAEKIPPFNLIAQQGIWALIHKATQGANYRDQRFVERIKAATDAGFLCGAYHFLTAENIDMQAELFCAVVQQFMPGNFALFADYEKSDHTPALHQLMQFIERVEGEFKDAAVGIYSGDLIRETLVEGSLSRGYASLNMAAAASFFSSRRLWLAEYGPHERIPWPWQAQTCDVWQFMDTGRLKNLIGNVDFSIYTGGDRAHLEARWKAGPTQATRAGSASTSNRGEMKG